jgi:hypothetical protein
MTTRTADDPPIVCPTCERPAPRPEWRLVLRWVKPSRPGAPAVRVLRHQPCDELAYVVLDSK